MFVSSMSSEELCAEAMKDFSILQTKIDLFMDRCGKRYRQEHFIGRFIKRMESRQSGTILGPLPFLLSMKVLHFLFTLR